MHPQILLADDHSMIRKGLKLYLQLNLGYSDIQEVDSCGGLMKELIKKRYTHLILDIILADGSTLEVIPNIRRVYPDLHIMIFSMQPAEIYGEAVKQFGINYYLSKSAGEEEIILALKNSYRMRLLSGKLYCHTTITHSKRWRQGSWKFCIMY